MEDHDTLYIPVYTGTATDGFIKVSMGQGKRLEDWPFWKRLRYKVRMRWDGHRPHLIFGPIPHEGDNWPDESWDAGS